MPASSPAAENSPPDHGRQRPERRTAATSEPTPFLRTWFPWAMLVLLFLATYNFDIPAEISRWHYAAAKSHYLDYYAQRKKETTKAEASLAAAFASLNKAIYWDPENPQLYRQRMYWHRDQGDIEAAIEDADQIVKLLPDDPGSLGERSELLLTQGKYKEALASADHQVEVLKKANSPNVYHVLNNRAYLVARSAAAGKATQKQIEQAIVDVRQALVDVRHMARLAGKRDLNFHLEVLRTQSMFLDTLGYLQYLHGDYQQALQTMNVAVHSGEYVREMKRDVLEAYESPQFEVLRNDDALKAHMAVLYHHRGLVLEKLDRTDEAERDLQLAQQLGYNPDKGVW